MTQTLLPVALARCDTYDAIPLKAVMAELWAAIAFQPVRGSSILVKPNLIAAKGGPLCCTQVEVVSAACELLLDLGVVVRVGDSPAFGSAQAVGRSIGLDQALARLNVPLVTLGRPKRLTLSFKAGIGVSRHALEADLLLSLPRLKAHGQLRLTSAVKNLFGCVTGIRKAFAHARFGGRGTRFEEMILDIMRALPPTVTVLDAITAMHVHGPIGGEPCHLGLLAASRSPVALDTAIYGILHTTPEVMPLWHEIQRQGLPGARPEELAFPLERPEAFDASGFVLPPQLSAMEFTPRRILRGMVRRIKARLMP